MIVFSTTAGSSPQVQMKTSTLHARFAPVATPRAVRLVVERLDLRRPDHVDDPAEHDADPERQEQDQPVAAQPEEDERTAQADA